MSNPDDNVSDQLQRWLDGDQPKALGSLIGVFGERSFPQRTPMTS